MRIITFTGLKGGSGKTTLSALFASWLFKEKKEKVALISFDKDGELEYLKRYESPLYPILLLEPHQFIEKVSKGVDAGIDNFVLDYSPYNADADRLIFELSDKIVLPFTDTLLDYTKLALWLNSAEKLKLENPIALLPVKVSNPEKYFSKIENFKKVFLALNIILLPYIPPFHSASYFSLSPGIFYKVNPSFNRLLLK